MPIPKTYEGWNTYQDARRNFDRIDWDAVPRTAEAAREVAELLVHLHRLASRTPCKFCGFVGEGHVHSVAQ